MASDQLNRVVDELEILQCDLEHMREYALSMKANISWDESVSQSTKWDYVAGTISALWSKRLIQWQNIVEKSQSLHILFQAHQISDRGVADAPDALKLAMIDYGATLKNTIELELLHLHLAVCDMHGMKETYTKHQEKGILSQRSNISLDYNKQGNRLEHALRKLSVWMSFYDQRSGRGALRRMLTELSKVRPDSRVNDSLSTIALLDAMRLIWLSGHVIPPDDVKSGPDREKAAHKRIDHMKNVHGLINMISNPKRYQHLGSLLRGFCECSSPKNRNSPTWLEGRNNARRHLVAFWRSAREEWRQHKGELRKELTDAVVGYMSFDTSPRYLAQVQEERKMFEVDLQRSRTAQPLIPKEINIVQSVWGDEPEISKPVRSKAKPIHNDNAKELELTSLNLNQQSEPEGPQVKLTIAVKQDSKRVFDKIFSRTAKASNFRWPHLINALIGAGMVATQSAGCAVRFKNDQGSIVFHSPHGYNHDSTLSAEFLRNEIGKRLTKWFSWDSETFVERTKDE